jgi:hypothetical protein
MTTPTKLEEFTKAAMIGLLANPKLVDILRSQQINNAVDKAVAAAEHALFRLGKIEAQALKQE